ncbi:bifunctional folylpolyglutamate synthase/dihydrofolate synthase [Desulfogranum mediterraneum]|uniref:bifunctional folylpolyglutamate synthase/dihydrofolate synthase n=1 Tax=Desulfogranum mediterraneum TaxID=160661 RepID=UPI0003F516EC|nr:folylpolyglutamate synthase/dihydrofolate synthase family protein [Desulfogranum mediterraneum]
MDYQQALATLDALQMFTIKLGLESIRELLAELDAPQEQFPTIHLAGTNGKGSVGANLVAMLSEAGYRVGFYSSPHLSSVRERFRINRQFISREEFAACAERLTTTLASRTTTYFEFTTALAFCWFQERGVDIAVVETGLGGRLDATNVLSPLVSVLTNIALDHQQHLGDTLAEIAREKAGIVKPGTPVVSGVLEPEAREVILERCHRLRSPLFTLGEEFSALGEPDLFHYSGLNETRIEQLHSPLPGQHQLANSCLALATMELLGTRGFPVKGDQLRAGLARVSWPGRMELLNCSQADSPPWPHSKKQENKKILIDGAHNEAGITALLRTLEQDFAEQPIILVWGSMADKELGPAWRRLLTRARAIILTQAEPRRSARPEQLAAQVPDREQGKLLLAPQVQQALEQAARLAKDDELICIAGSLYLVGAARELLCGPLTQKH